MKILQISKNNWATSYSIPTEIEWYFVDSTSTTITLEDVDSFSAVIVNEKCELSLLEAIDKLVEPYTFLVDQSIVSLFDLSYYTFFNRKMKRDVDFTDIQAVISLLTKQYFPKQYGEKLPVRKLLYSPNYKGKVWFEGTKYLTTEVDIGEKFKQLLFWKLSIHYDQSYDMDLWLEYQKEGDCEIALDIQFYPSGSVDHMLYHNQFSETDMKNQITLSFPIDGYLSCSIFAKGTGKIRIGDLHQRRSRLGIGQLLPGGQRFVDEKRQEFFYYFHPGNLKPPLTIYFGGYGTMEGFEGFYMMKGLGQPFILFRDPRLEGGNFYIGSETYELAIKNIIQNHKTMLGFQDKDLLFSGLSMGSFAALYYGSMFESYAILIGKPIINVEYIANRVRLDRPYDFLTSLDMFWFWEKTDSNGNVIPIHEFFDSLVKRWSEEPGFGETRLVIAYMKQDDYDDKAYYSILKSQAGKQTEIIARGFQGRHNDNTHDIVNWFVNQYKRVIVDYTESRDGSVYRHL